MEIFKWLDDKDFVESYIVHDFRESSTAYYLNIQAQFIDGSILYARQYVETDRRKYSFHWQKTTGDLILRWDNAPHFPNLATYPHHKHVGETSVETSHDISLEDVLKYIKLNIIFPAS